MAKYVHKETGIEVEITDENYIISSDFEPVKEKAKARVKKEG